MGNLKYLINLERSHFSKTKGKNIALKDTGSIFRLNKEIKPILNHLHQVDYSESYWLRLLFKHLKVCYRLKHYLEKEDFKPNVLLFPINSFHPLNNKSVLKEYFKYFLKAFERKRNTHEEIKKLNKFNNILMGQRSNVFQKYIEGTIINSLFFPELLILSGNKNKRNVINEIANREKDIFLKNVLISLPKIFVEFFDKINNKIDLYDPLNKIFHVEHLGSFVDDFILAKYRENGSKIITYQGGGGLGERAYNPSNITYQVIDEFHTFGWTIHSKDKPDLPYRLIEYAENWDFFREKEKNVKNSILVVFSSITETTLPYYHKFVNDLFSSLPSNLRSKVIIRPRPKSRKISNYKEAKKLNIPNDVSIDNGKRKMAEAAANVEIVVQTTLPATNFLECIYVGQPVMAINTNDEPSELWQSFVPVLERLGVIYNSLEELIDAVINTKDYTEWWKNVEADKHFQEFAATFAGKY